MFNIYILNNASKINKLNLIKNLPNLFIKHVNKFKNDNQKNIEVISYLLLTNLLKKKTNIKNISFSIYGKPYIRNSKIHFNLSNTKNIVVCALSNYPVGVDVVETNSIKLDNVSHILHHNELSRYKNSLNKKLTFAKFWVIKEAYLKYKGTGFIKAPNKLDTTKIKHIHIKMYKNYVLSYYSIAKLNRIIFLKSNTPLLK